ncbi:MAG: hypothetical protein AAFS12_07245, partial [Cyanobacteria bacterium J06632_19]
ATLQNVNYPQTLIPIAFCLLPFALSQLLFSMPTYLTAIFSIGLYRKSLAELDLIAVHFVRQKKSVGLLQVLPNLQMQY